MKIGDKVKLKSYEGWGDYVSHKGQQAEITHILETSPVGGSFYVGDFRIEWKDGTHSLVNKNNLILIGGQHYKKYSLTLLIK